MNILIKPLVTEKMTQQGEKLNKFGFIVAKKANKIQIKKAVEEMYGVTVADINTLIYRANRKSRFTKSGVIGGKTNAFKKAVVTLNEGETIDFYSNI
ncbi:MAG: 50S ribosomal protein L23 [Bacteroidales bacterium]|nr:50S ribosomal protein L23 [Bacteroidales bacterium]